MATLKQRKEQFVSDLVGGSVLEIDLVTGIPLWSYIVYQLIKSSLLDVPFIVDFAINALSILLAITIYSDRINQLYLLIALPIVGLAIGKLARKRTPSTTRTSTHLSSSPSSSSSTTDILRRKAFLTVYRSQMIIITNFSILAVDFNIFPRRFAKVETWGTSLMDLGVGSFVFSMGLVNSRDLIKKLYTSANYKFLLKSYLLLIKKNTIKAIPVLGLGIIRLISVKSLEYQEHVTEYGVHWNFFFTLGFLPIIIAILDPLLQYFPRMMVAFGIISLYELILANTDLLRFILSNENRGISLFTQNKEGFFSFIGYLSIFIFGQSFGSFVLTNIKTEGNLFHLPKINKADKSRKIRNRKSPWTTVTSSQGLLYFSIFYQLLFWYAQQSPYFFAVSRRLANFTYVIWVVSFNAYCLFFYNLLDEVLGWKFLGINSSLSSPILEATNNNGLLAFLLGNLGTGLVNMSINTLDTNQINAFAILTFYMLILTVILLELDKRKIYIKI